MLGTTNINVGLMKVVRKFDDGASSKVKIGDTVTKRFGVKILKQECCLLPILFKSYLESVLQERRRNSKNVDIPLYITHCFMRMIKS